MYQFDSRVRYSEIGADGHVPIDGIVNYFQDCSTFHSEDVGLGMKRLYEKGRGWVLSSWQVVVKRYPKVLEKLTICTWPYDFKGLYGNRNFLMKDESGEHIAWANSIWVFMDTNTGRPVRPEEEDIAGYGLEEKYKMEYVPRKICLPEDFKKEEPFAIRRSHLDTNQHVNNGQYIRLAGEYVPAGRKISELRASYKRSALLGDVIYPMVHEEEGKIFVVLADESESPYVILEFFTE